MSKRIIIDVTQLAHWPGQLTGVPRVMDEISKRYAVTGCQLVVWDAATQGFQAVTYDGLRAATPAASSAPAEATWSMAKRTVKALERRSPQLERTRRAVQSRLKKAAPASSVAHFVPQPSDCFIVLWGAWDDQNYIDRLVQLDNQGVRLIQLVYDMLPVVTPQFSGHSTAALERFATAIYPRCQLLLAISEYTKHDIVAWLQARQLAVPPIEVFRLGDDFSFTKAKAPAEKQRLLASGRAQPGFVLTVGTIETRKNHSLLYYVYKLAKARSIDLPLLVIVGRRGWLTDDIYSLMTTDPDTKDQFVFIEHASDEELSWLYEHCRFTIYQSFYEGWGLPIAESIARGVPCIASNTSSMPEIAGDLIDYFSPSSTDECLAAIQALLDDAKIEQAHQRLKHYKLTSWDESFAMINKYVQEFVV